MHDVKVPLCMQDFSSSKIINHHFHIDNGKGESGVGYGIIIGRGLMVQLVLTAAFKRQLIKWDSATVPMKEPISFLGEPDLNKRNMSEVVMQNLEPAYTREATEKLVKILYSTYAKADLSQVAANPTQLNSEEGTELLKLLEYLEYLFDDTLGDWNTEPVDLERNPGYKIFDSKYYMVPRINKETFCKELKC